MSIEKAIILSAGQGSRLLPLTRDIPKCLIDLNGRTLIGWQVAALAANGIKDIVVVTGFRTERVEDHALQLYRDTGVRIRTLFNPFFQVADNLGTCWIAREEMDRDFIILNGDTIISDEIVAKLIAGANEPITVTVDVKPDYDDDDMKVNRDGEGRLHHIGKRLLPPDTNAESIGMLAFVGDGPSIFRNQVDQMMRTPKGSNAGICANAAPRASLCWSAPCRSRNPELAVEIAHRGWRCRHSVAAKRAAAGLDAHIRLGQPAGSRSARRPDFTACARSGCPGQPASATVKLRMPPFAVVTRQRHGSARRGRPSSASGS